MTSLYLLLWIAGGILLQIAVYLGVGFRHHWQDYQALRNIAAGSDIAVTPEASIDAQEITSAAWLGLRTFRVERKVLEDAAGQICSFYLEPEDGKPLAPFLPGQFLTFRLDIPASKGGTASVIRCYSLSDAPQQNTYRVSIKRAPAPVGKQTAPGVSSNFFHDHVKEGSLLQVRAPSGHFYMDRSESPVVLIGGGIGITPMLSMLNWCLTVQPRREVWLFYGVRNSSELVMQSHLQDLAKANSNFHLHLCFSDPLAADLVDNPARHGHHHHSRVDVELLRRLLPLKPYHFYICGPTPMLASLVPALEDWGVPDGRIHFEAFGPASVTRKRSATAHPSASLANGNGDAVMVMFAKSGKQLPWQPGMGSLLDFAEANGIAVNSGCRAGGCGSCQTSIRTGEVTYTQSPDFDPEPGSCLLCVCTPKTAVTLEV
ncbi:MAG: 2Fe-2S iron-sulfur cluster-binding protein [Rhodoferax sp.]|nr:2Fe-2S iron-sulfur cluster-binding protein [Rhodoferax sp.]